MPSLPWSWPLRSENGPFLSLVGAQHIILVSHLSLGFLVLQSLPNFQILYCKINSTFRLVNRRHNHSLRKWRNRGHGAWTIMRALNLYQHCSPIPSLLLIVAFSTVVISPFYYEITFLTFRSHPDTEVPEKALINEFLGTFLDDQWMIKVVNWHLPIKSSLYARIL